MFKHIKQALTTALSFLALSVSLCANASEIDTIDVCVLLERDGTAHISERWAAVADHNGTELYISLKNMGEMKVTNFKVRENGSYFLNNTPWDVDLSREEKTGKCGINRLDGNDCELCWGIGESGFHSWTAEYDVDGFVKQFDDGCGFNHTFVNYGLSSAPKFVRTTIAMADSTPLCFDNSRIWAFQYKGTCKFEDGKIVAVCSEPFTTDNSMIVMSLFPKDMFNSSNIVNDTIGAMKWLALEGSDYLNEYTEQDYAEGRNVLTKDEDDFSWWEEVLLTLAVIAFGGLLYGLGYFIMMFGFLFGIIILWNVVSLRPLRIFLRRKKLMKDATNPYFKGIPINGDLNRAFYVLDENNYKVLPEDKDNLYAAYLVRLMRQKAISIVSTVENGKVVNRLAITNEKIKWNEVAIKSGEVGTCAETSLAPVSNTPATGVADASNEGKKLHHTNQSDKKEKKPKDCMRLLYKAIKEAAGENKILEKGELKNYLLKNEGKAQEIVAATACSTEEATPQEFQELMGLKKFLEDFTILNTADAVEVELWDEYLVYATLFGIADKVLKNFKECCPDYFNKSALGSQLIDDEGNVVSDFNSYTGITSLGRGIQSWTNTSTSSSSSGGGGSSSSGGGGGSSGGGGGGGFR